MHVCECELEDGFGQAFGRAKLENEPFLKAYDSIATLSPGLCSASSIWTKQNAIESDVNQRHRAA